MQQASKSRPLSGKDFAKALAIGIATGVVLAAINVVALRTGISPLPGPLALAFAKTLLEADLPLPLGLAFHVAWVTLWSVVYVRLFRDHPTFGRALALAAALWLLVLVGFFPFVGWGVLGLAVSPLLIMASAVSHLLFAIVLWLFTRVVFASRDEEHSPIAVHR